MSNVYNAIPRNRRSKQTSITQPKMPTIMATGKAMEKNMQLSKLRKTISSRTTTTNTSKPTWGKTKLDIYNLNPNEKIDRRKIIYKGVRVNEQTYVYQIIQHKYKKLGVRKM